jgi:rubredoxin
MNRYVCEICGYVYDPAKGSSDNRVKSGTAFEDLPDDWACPLCNAEKKEFTKKE